MGSADLYSPCNSSWPRSHVRWNTELLVPGVGGSVHTPTKSFTRLEPLPSTNKKQGVFFFLIVPGPSFLISIMEILRTLPHGIISTRGVGTCANLFCLAPGMYGCPAGWAFVDHQCLVLSRVQTGSGSRKTNFLHSLLIWACFWQSILEQSGITQRKPPLPLNTQRLRVQSSEGKQQQWFSEGRD